MKVPAIISKLFTKAAVAPLAFGEGWPVREPFAGAFQSHVTIDPPRDITTFSAVYACMSKISNDIAKLRPMLVRDNPDKTCTEVQEQSPFRAVLEKPNHFQNRISFAKQWVLSKLMWGNTYALKRRDGRGLVVASYILDPQRVKTLVTDDGGVYYELSPDNLAGVKAITVPASEIFHDLTSPLWHPLVGVAPLYAGAISATMGNRIQKNSTGFFQNMSRPGGALVAPGKLDDADADKLKRSWESNFGGANAGRTAVLANGLKFEPMGAVPAEQAQLVDQLKWTVEDVARCFGVPLYKIGGPIPPNTTVEALNQTYYDDCLHILIEDMELCLQEGLALPRGTYVELDLDGLLRMDKSAQAAVTKILIGSGVEAPDEARLRFNRGPVPGGKYPYLQEQNYSLEALAKRDALPDPFAKKTDAAPPAPPAANAESYAAAFNDIFIKGLRASAA